MHSCHCAGAGGWGSPRVSASPSRSLSTSPGMPGVLSPRFPTPLPPARSGKEVGSPPRLHGLGSGKGWRAAEAFPRVCGKSGSGKVSQSSQQRRPRTPLLGEETAVSVPVLPPPAQRPGLACWERPGLPAGRPSSRAEKPQLTQAARKAEAVRPNCPGRAAAPTPGACTGAAAAHRGGGPAEAPRAASRSFQALPFYWPGVPGQGSAFGATRAATLPGTSTYPFAPRP